MQSNEDLRLPEHDDRQTIQCIYCLKAQQVSRRAMRLTCKFCSKTLRIEEMPIKDYQARRSIETCGMVTVEKKGHVVSDRILCGSLIVRGKVKGNVVSRGVVLVGPNAEILGNVTAPSLAVGEGAILEGKYHIGEETAAAADSPTQHMPLKS